MAAATADDRFVRLCDMTGDKLPPQRPTLIDGLLRQGHKMLLAGPPKAGKTWLAIHLAYAVANGTEWLGHQCKEGEVCIVDGEMDPASFYHRCDAVARALWPGMDAAGRALASSNITALHLRGDAETDVWGLLGLLKARYGDEPPALVIIDPIYKLLEGDENSNSEMRGFVKGLDAIAAWGPSVCITHHHAKGRAGDRVVTDRAAGAGVFSRDPDAFVDLTPLDVREGTEHWAALCATFPRRGGEDDDAWRERLLSKPVLRASMVLREFPDRKGGEWAFDWPLMRPVDGMADAPEEGTAESGRRRGTETMQSRAEERWAFHDSILTDAIDQMAARGDATTRDSAFDEYEKLCREYGEKPYSRGRLLKETRASGTRLSWVYDERSGLLVERDGQGGQMAGQMAGQGAGQG